MNTVTKSTEKVYDNIHPIDCMHRTINLLTQKAETADTETLLNIASVMTEMYKVLSTIVE